MEQPTLLVLAAGMGSRYGGLKQIDPMGPHGETILDYSVFDAIRAGFGKVVFVIREDFEKAFREAIGARFSDRIAVDYAFQRLDDIPKGFTIPPRRTKPWGTAHAVYAAREAVKEPFAVINADDFYGGDAYRKAAAFLTDPQHSSAGVSCLVGYYLKNTLSDYGGVNRGVTTHADKLLCDVEEIIDIRRREDGAIQGARSNGDPRTLDEEALVSMNFWGFSPHFFGQLAERFTAFLQKHSHEPGSECYIPSVVDGLVSDHTTACHVLATTGTWFGVTYPKDKPMVVAALSSLIAAGEYPEKLA